eukprot:127145_1
MKPTNRWFRTKSFNKFIYPLFFLSFAANITAQSVGDLRLVNGTAFDNGRVEIYYSGQWGTICNDLFDVNDIGAGVICRQLGYSDGIFINPLAAGNGIIWLDDITCIGTETHISNCSHLLWGVNNCNHDEDVGVDCLGTRAPTFQPTKYPTTIPTSAPTVAPTDIPTALTASPTSAPSLAPTTPPTLSPTNTAILCGTFKYCYYVDIYPVSGVATEKTITIQQQYDSGNSNYEIFIKSRGGSCFNPTITLEYEQIDIADANEYIDVYEDSYSGSDTCDAFWTNTYINVDEEYNIRLYSTSSNNAFCSHGYKINA